MKIIKPDYYDKFRCAADKCEFTCCRDWKIGVDDLTLKKWEKTPVPEINCDRASILPTDKINNENSEMRSETADKKTDKCKMLSDYVRPDTGLSAICLNERGFCPFFNKEGLCALVISYGEGMLSDTCHTYPRERHEFKKRQELTLNCGCPEVLRLLWECSEFNYGEESTEKEESETGVVKNDSVKNDSVKNDSVKNDSVKDDSVKADSVKDDAVKVGAGEEYFKDYDRYAPEGSRRLFDIRDRFINILKNKDLPLEIEWKMIFYIGLDIYNRTEEKGQRLTGKYLDETFSKDSLDALACAIEKVQCDPYDRFCEQNELFLDLAENYRKKKIYSDVLEPLAKQAEMYENKRLKKQALKKQALKKREEFEQIWKGYEDEIRVLMQEEMYSTLYLPTGNEYTMMLKLEWMGIFLAVLKQCLFLDHDLRSVSDKDAGSNDKVSNKTSDKNSNTDDKNGDKAYDKAYDKTCDKIYDKNRLKMITLILIRMTGYSEDDIEEYLENSFEEIIWEWGYMSLIVG